MSSPSQGAVSDSALDVEIDELHARAFTIPTDEPESDGTLSWSATTMVLVHARAGGHCGLGYSYCAASAATLINDTLSDIVCGLDGASPPAAWQRMRTAVRNIGYPGIAASAISAVDVALWDLKARLLGTPLSGLLGRVRERVPIYGSGGFTSYSDQQLADQLEGWAAQGITAVKIKIGSEPQRDPQRVRQARSAIGPAVDLFVDANGALQRKQALRLAEVLVHDSQVSWFEEPVSSDDLAGLALLRDRVPAPMRIAAGEYGYDLFYFRQMLAAGAVDVLQADVTRCGGITPMLAVGALCEAAQVPLSAHTSPTLHAHVGAALTPLLNVEYFHDHARIEQLLLDGVPQPNGGALQPDPSAPGLGLALREPDAARYEL